MANGYKILWTDHAMNELSNTIEYLEENWTKRDLKNFANKLNNTVDLLSTNPYIFQKSESTGIRRAIVAQHNTLYYRLNDEVVEILSFFSHRKNPNKRKL
ncbi:type II toxin-antitoxin system RelE/ParE family toxin [Flavobacterium sp. DG1-102-2]|uniref:type II toxin-antitoxin system RelE/ParE family toxin n=1 Tax=Flavobacterium sp. DG1-102-2 TaxID=3081663 RepID=UPI002948E861|nr:type II toxin-antitoxin system RelE/ParE family toxin [Flavobacterium sp. DG1-102-2]MDV6168895.1 type II toxin-antitoxin system RelE/ParE family toxin [Flavobacterium sp. DG1-102-2]